jgi:pilus assembly protein Flp/PilA
MLRIARHFFHDDQGATAVEYGLIAALIVVVIAVAIPALGGSVRAMFESVVGAFAH